MARGGLRFCVLGRLAVERDGVSAEGLGGRRAELVFAFLAVEHRRLITRDELADALWPDCLPDTWAASLRGVVSDVRRFLDDASLDGNALLERSQRGYRLRLPGDMSVDLDEAKAAVAQARDQLDSQPAVAAQRAEVGAELAALPFLPEHEGTWVDDVRRQVARLHIAALDIQARALSAAGDHRAASTAAERLVRADPLTESAHQRRIAVHAAGGDRAGALRAYEDCRRVLAEELHVEPSADTEAVMRRAVAERPLASAPVPSVASPYAGYAVLVVEDHDFHRRTAVALLRSLGVTDIAEASDGVDALRQLGAAAPPDVIVCDIDMPGMDGVEFIRHIAVQCLGSALVIVSGMERSVVGAVGAVTEAHGLQVLGVVEKPLTSRKLAEILGRYRPAQRDAATAPLEVDATAVLSAIARGDVRIGFAPLVDLIEGQVSGAVASASWHGYERSPVAAGRFLPVLGAAGRTAPFTDFMLDRACAELVDLAAEKLEVRLWLPLPDAEVDDLGLADRLVAPVRSQGLDPGDIVWMVGGSGLRRRRADELASLIRLRLKGFGLALDGLGPDLSLPPAATRLPITAIRFAQLLGGAPAGLTALDEALALARSLEVTAVIAGCVTLQEFQLLVSLGCPLAEGPPGDDGSPVGAVASLADGWELPTGVGPGT